MNPIHINKVQAAILEIRGQKVLLDQEVAKIYGVQTKRINEAVRNNPEKFPPDYLLQLAKAEWEALKSKFSTSKRGGKVKLPAAFPEKGLYMMATMLGLSPGACSSMNRLRRAEARNKIHRFYGNCTGQNDDPRKIGADGSPLGGFEPAPGRCGIACLARAGPARNRAPGGRRKRNRR
jgi:hypothetical protein